MDIPIYMTRHIKLEKGELNLREDQILGFIEKTVTPFGNSAKVDCPKQYIGKRAYLIICEK
jgi:putative transposon-encoded protein